MFSFEVIILYDGCDYFINDYFYFPIYILYNFYIWDLGRNGIIITLIRRY